jgi:dihydrodipicolinate synthase/N-acetylneuraminate lyase
MLLGGQGDISVTANVAPKLMVQLCAAALQGNRDEALALDQKLLPLHNAMFVESNPIPAKWALSKMGLIDQAIRLPMTQLSKKNQVEVDAAIESLGLA